MLCQTLVYAASSATSVNGTRTFANGTIIYANGTIGNATNTSVRAEASYPQDLLTYEQIRKGGFILYILGNSLPHKTFIAMFYFFYGISLATQNFINPAIDVIKAKGVVSYQSIY